MVDEESPPLLDNEVCGNLSNGSRIYPNIPTLNNNINNINSTTTTHSTTTTSTTKPDNGHIPNGGPISKAALSNARGSVACSSKAFRPRLVAKDGDCLIQPIHLPHHYRNMYRLAIRFVFMLVLFSSPTLLWLLLFFVIFLFLSKCEN